LATEYIKTVECPKCRYKNVAGTKFCGDCGTALGGSPIPCGTCGTENPSGTKFCGNCGSNLQNPQENDPDVRHLQDALRGKYVVQKPLGEGGFGRVFLAEHSGLGQKHVIKLLSADSSRSTDIRNRFFQEAQLIARLKHPNIVPIMDVAEYLGRPYYIMSYLNGGSLEDLLIKEKKLSSEKALQITAKILSALSEVHSKGIIHRDLKPNNVLLDESGEPVLIDFGIARVEEGSKAKTGTGFSIGTPVYMSPEQLDAKPISLTTDIYSMGIMLFELLTGKPPFEGSMSSLITQHNTAKLPGVSGKIDNSKLADGIQAVLQKACAKEPSARYSSAKEMREAVLGFLEKPKVTSSTVEPAKVFTNSIGIKFQYIPEGEFMMGLSPGDSNGWEDEKPSHRVEISHPFYMGRYPVTKEEWTRVMGDKPFYFQNAGRTAPAEYISWNRVQEFLKKLNEMESRDGSRGKAKYRLPTEAEWEYAARAGTTTELYVGKLERNGYWESKPLDRIGWFAGNAIASYEGARETDEIAKLKGLEYYKDAPHKKIGTQPVGKKEPNPWGLYDTIGNVWEWCEDWFSEDYYGKSEIIDPKGPNNGEKKVVRGGSWYNDARSCRVSDRYSSAPDLRNSTFGFRLLLPLS
jgi:serine/threonine protein kinase